MHINPQIFREYDIRGKVDSDLSEEFAELLGRAYGSWVSEQGLNNIGIGHDCRITSPAYAQALARGIAAEGIDVFLTGMGPTPQLYFSLFRREYGGGIQVTGSHNPSDMNGFKICLGKRTLSGKDIQELKTRMETRIDAKPTASPGSVTESPIGKEYLESLVEGSRSYIGDRKLKIVVDAGNGVGGLIGPNLLRQLGAEVVELYCEPDGTFPNHHPDPTELKNIIELQSSVRDNRADFGIGWDGDADRIGVVDERGDVLFGDMLVLLFGRQILSEVPGATIIGDVKCSTRLFADIEKRGGTAVMWKTGHSLIKSKLAETNGALAGEMSGHIFFKHRYYGFDDALYASARLMEIMSHTEQPLSQLLADLPPAVSTPEIRIDCPEEVKFKIPQLAQQAFSEFTVDTTDGVRIQFDHGWGLVRASNTQPVLVMRFEAENEGQLEEYQKLVVDRIEKIREEVENAAVSL